MDQRMDSEKLEQLNAQLKREGNIERGPVSASANAIKDFMMATPDPLIEGVPNKDNPFISKRTCTLL